MAKKKTQSEDVNFDKAEKLLHTICVACDKADLKGHDILYVLMACMTEVSFRTFSKEPTNENFEEFSELIKQKLLEGLIIYRDNEEQENGNENK